MCECHLVWESTSEKTRIDSPSLTSKSFTQQMMMILEDGFCAFFMKEEGNTGFRSPSGRSASKWRSSSCSSWGSILSTLLGLSSLNDETASWEWIRFCMHSLPRESRWMDCSYRLFLLMSSWVAIIAFFAFFSFVSFHLFLLMISLFFSSCTHSLSVLSFVSQRDMSSPPPFSCKSLCLWSAWFTLTFFFGQEYSSSPTLLFPLFLSSFIRCQS